MHTTLLRLSLNGNQDNLTLKPRFLIPLVAKSDSLNAVDVLKPVLLLYCVGFELQICLEKVNPLDKYQDTV